MPQPGNGLRGVAIDDLTVEKLYSAFRPRPAAQSKPTVVESRPGAQCRATATAVAVKANRFEESAVTRLQYARSRRSESRYGGEGLRREMLANQEVRPTLRAGRVVGAGELHQHVSWLAI